LGNEKVIKSIIKSHNLGIEHLEIIDTRNESEEERRNTFAKWYFEKRKRRGVTMNEAQKIMMERNHFGCMLVETGYADALISGLTRNYPNTIRPALRIIGKHEDARIICGMYIIITKKGPLFLADTTVNYNPTAQDLAAITQMAAEAVSKFKIEPRIALLSYSNFGSSDGEDAVKVREAVAKLHAECPDLIVDGEVQANFALDKHLMQEIFPFSPLAAQRANTLIFPNLAAGNIAYKLLQNMSETELIGPILLGMKKPVHVLQLGSSVREIVNMITIAVVDAQSREKSE
jgi:malate dehydrogenase (oxaloacetate-decarboxylating)(NADP+)